VRKRDLKYLREVLREERLLADRRSREFAAELQRQREEMREHFAKQDRKIDEMVAEGKAGRAALFAMIDRLDRMDPGGGAARA
jgi:hypothetical protein